MTAASVTRAYRRKQGLLLHSRPGSRCVGRPTAVVPTTEAVTLPGYEILMMTMVVSVVVMVVEVAAAVVGARRTSVPQESSIGVKRLEEVVAPAEAVAEKAVGTTTNSGCDRSR